MRLQEEIGQTVPFRTKGQEALVAIVRTAGLLLRRYDAALEPYGLTVQQYNVLRILRGARGKIRTLDIGERMLQQTPGITRLIDRLVEKGLVERARCSEDRRVVWCLITPAGSDLLAQTDELINVLDDQVASGLEEAELDALLATLERVRGEACSSGSR